MILDLVAYRLEELPFLLKLAILALQHLPVESIEDKNTEELLLLILRLIFLCHQFPLFTNCSVSGVLLIFFKNRNEEDEILLLLLL